MELVVGFAALPCEDVEADGRAGSRKSNGAKSLVRVTAASRTFSSEFRIRGGACVSAADGANGEGSR